MKIDRPIFILAPARSGTTIFYNLFTRHRETAFPEHFADKYWKSSMKIKLIPILVKQQMIRYKIRPLPHEGAFWRKFHPYSTLLTEKDVKNEEEKYFFNIINAELKAFNAKRFVCRAHDFMLQIRYLNKIFPDSFYIILKRDVKAIVNSQYTILRGEWSKEGKNSGNNYGRVIEKFSKDGSILNACINYIKFYTDTMNKDLEFVKNRSINIQYEKFVMNPRDELKKLFEFTELKWYDKLENEIPRSLQTKNIDKWKSLPEKEKKILEEAFPEN